MLDSFKHRLKQLPLMKKLTLFGAGLSMTSVFLPWYFDLDRFDIGNTFLGVTGPLYLAGLLVFLASAISFGYILVQLFDKSAPSIPVSEKHFYIFNSGLILFLLVLETSVYFHSKFGINLTDKNIGFGMIMAFVGAGLMMFGTLMGERKKAVSFDYEGHLEPLIDLSEQRKTGSIDIDRNVSLGEAMDSYKKDHTKAWGPVQKSIADLTDERRSEQTKDILL